MYHMNEDASLSLKPVQPDLGCLDLVVAITNISFFYDYKMLVVLYHCRRKGTEH